MSELSWDRLLCKERFRASPKSPEDHRSEFERDYDRVVFSSSFRRLQDKTQVWPLEAHDFIRTRLTHSCEAAVIGRSLATGVFGELQKMKTCIAPAEAGAVVMTASLLHDIGNPPFGHTGEEHIAGWFQELFKADPKIDLTEAEREDLIHFEGNAHALRLATRLQTLGKPYGLNLTFGTLSALVKYPKSSLQAASKSGKKKKFGYFQSEAQYFENIRAQTGLSGEIRHPLTFLVEAADDIAYSTADIEDGFKKGTFSFSDFVDASNSADSVVKNLVETRLAGALKEVVVQGPKQELQQLAFQQFRAWAVGEMIASCVRAFVGKYEAIINGKLEGDLLRCADKAVLADFLKRFAVDNVYNAQEVVKTERAARHVIRGLLTILWEEAMAGKSKLLDKLVRNVRPDESGGKPMYIRCQMIADYVAGMTDTFAMNLYARLTGGGT